MADKSTAPLAGIKVIDWTQVQSGPSCTQILAWLGAEVIKLEKVHGGDPTRNEMNDVDGSYSLYFLQLNANKKSITLDMGDPEGKKILTDLLKDADVFVENIGPGDVEKLGFGWTLPTRSTRSSSWPRSRDSTRAAASNMSRPSSLSPSAQAALLRPPAGGKATRTSRRSPALPLVIRTPVCT